MELIFIEVLKLLPDLPMIGMPHALIFALLFLGGGGLEYFLLDTRFRRIAVCNFRRSLFVCAFGRSGSIFDLSDFPS